MRVIHKFELEGCENRFDLPPDARVLHVDVQGVRAFLWVLLDPLLGPVDKRKFIVITTGERFDPSGMEFVGSFVIPANSLTSSFVGHVFEDFR